MATILAPSQALNRTFRRNVEPMDSKDCFRKALQLLLAKLKMDKEENEEEEHSKTWIHDFLMTTFYGHPYSVNTSKKVDQAIFGPDSSHPWILLEMKSPVNKTEMPREGQFDRKGFCQLVLYYLTEERQRGNNEIKHLIVTNGYEWYVFERKLFYNHFGKNDSLWKKVQRYERENKDRDEVYRKVIAPEVRKVQEHFTYVYFDLRQYEARLSDDAFLRTRSFETLCKFFSPTHLCMLPYQFDHNNLDTKFYNELLYIMGVEEKRVGQLDLITRLPEEQRQHYSLLEQSIWHLTELGLKDEEELYDTAMGLVITWMNRILFLKLLETQLLNFNGGDKRYQFLSPALPNAVKGYHALFDLFFKVLSKNEDERDPHVAERYARVPYLNSALFEVSELEKRFFTINALPHGEMQIYPATALKDGMGHVKKGQMDSLDYLLQFLDAYDFGSYETEEETEEEQKTLIDASVLGLIFEKINGYKEGAYFTPGYICEYMCHEVIERVVIERMNEHFKWECQTMDEVVERLDYYSPDIRRQANAIINAIRLCDPSVGSGHFLVSALNELIAIKDRLHILEYSPDAGKYAGQRVVGWSIEVADDELVIVNKEQQTAFAYDQRNLESAALQRTLFDEKRRIISHCLYGVDINPKSVDICRLRLWIELLKNAYYDSGKLQTLPNIDLNIKEGDALMSYLEVKTGSEPGKRIARATDIKELVTEYQRLVMNYKQSSGQADRMALNRQIHDVKRELRSFVQTDFYDYEVSRVSGKDTEQHYMEWMLEFPDLLDETAHFTGFDIIVGNPPYISLGANKGRLRKRYKKRGYETFNGNGDICVLFFERGLNVLKPHGYIHFITTSKWLRAEYGQEIRNYLTTKANPLCLVDFPKQRLFAKATVETCILLLSRDENAHRMQVCSTVKLEKGLHAYVQKNLIPCNFNGSEEWVIRTSMDDIIKERVETKGKPLKEWGAKINLGLLTGRASVFIVSDSKRQEILSHCQDIDELNRTSELFKPVLKGRDLQSFHIRFADRWMIHTHNGIKDEKNKKIVIIPRIDINDYPALKSYLDQHFESIRYRDAQGDTPYNLRNSVCWPELEKPKIVWGDLTDLPKFCYDEEGKYYCENTTYFMTVNHPIYLVVYLNSPLSQFLFSKLGSTSGVGTIRWQRFTVGRQLVPTVTSEDEQRIIDLYRVYQQTRDEAHIQEAYNIIYNTVGLTDEEIAYINNKNS